MSRDPSAKITRRKFTEAEDIILKANWLTATSNQDLLDLLPEWPWTTIYGRAAIIGLPKRNFRKERAIRPRRRRTASPALRPRRRRSGPMACRTETGAWFQPSMTEADFISRVKDLGGYPYYLLSGPNAPATVWPFRAAAA